MTATASLPTGKRPWLLARCTQVGIALAAIADVPRAIALRDDQLHPTAASMHRSGLTSMVYLDVMLVTVVLFLIWFVRGRRTARRFSVDAFHTSDAAAVGSWLMPLFNLWLPRRLLLEMWQATSRDEAERFRGNVVVNAWWVAWAGHVVCLVGNQLTQDNSLVLLVLAEVLLAVAAVLVIWLIQHVTALQNAALRKLPAAGPLLPA
ncbi:DUF4328 domain-containing protein [Streptomyces sp. NPDC086787]|uniref:DUF4328 domain-containing protein n=1 Tax=Streptomyces sp. NPDC086787 TaxID=3365759 RepID=UPI0038072503